MSDPLLTLREYHRRTRHRFEAYAAGPEALDWEAQPAPFRHYANAPHTPLPLYDQQALNGAADLRHLAALLQLALGITAWKQFGPDRWPVRANPSSGNLHPVEAYVLVRHWPGLADGLYHYCPDLHALEGRATLPSPSANHARTPQLALGLSTAAWREAWKYGERAFRYCQLDVGHALGALAAASALVGWSLQPQSLPADRLAHLLGLDRAADFVGGRRSRPETEAEEAEVLLAVTAVTAQPAPGPDWSDWLNALDSPETRWSGPASTLDAHPFYHWPLIGEAQRASRPGIDPPSPAPRPTPSLAPALAPSLSPPAYSAALLQSRRSAQRYDPGPTLAATPFARLLAVTHPDHSPCWQGFEPAPRLDLLLFIHRVEGLEPGLYLLPRARPDAAHPPAGEPLHYPAWDELRPSLGAAPLYRLQTLAPVALRRLARSLHCHQDLAANSAFALGMITRQPPEQHYREGFHEAGRLGQALYLEAEAQGLRGCGIGCFFDAPVADLLPAGAGDSLYHFTVGFPITDPRIETLPPYQHLSSPARSPAP